MGHTAFYLFIYFLAKHFPNIRNIYPNSYSSIYLLAVFLANVVDLSDFILACVFLIPNLSLLHIVRKFDENLYIQNDHSISCSLVYCFSRVSVKCSDENFDRNILEIFFLYTTRKIDFSLIIIVFILIKSNEQGFAWPERRWQWKIIL